MGQECYIGYSVEKYGVMTKVRINSLELSQHF